MWNKMHVTEKEYLTTPRRDPSYKAKYKPFIHAQQTFDKVSKAKKGRTLRNKVRDLEKANTSDPKAFWNFIKRLPQNNAKKFCGKP